LLSIAAHTLNDVDEVPPFLGQAILYTRRYFCKRLTGENALFFKRAQSFRECLGADAVERAF
jgi:hypothetical protein